MEPMKNNQKKIGIFPMYGPKLPESSLKNGCLFSATVTPNLSDKGVIKSLVMLFTLFGTKLTPKIDEANKTPIIIAMTVEMIGLGNLDIFEFSKYLLRFVLKITK